MKSKTLSIMFVDIQGFTSRTAQQTREENQLFVREIRAFTEKHVKNREGILVKAMGDGFLAIFESATNAVICGIEMQKEIERRNANILNSDNFVRFRIGISTGEVSIGEDGDVYGDAVNIAARIQKFAEPNEVFISESTYLAMNKTEIKALDLGPQKFKNVLQEVRVYRVLKDIKGTAQIIQRQLSKSKRALGIGVIVLIIIVISSSIFNKRAKMKQQSTVTTPTVPKESPTITSEEGPAIPPEKRPTEERPTIPSEERTVTTPTVSKERPTVPSEKAPAITSEEPPTVPSEARPALRELMEQKKFDKVIQWGEKQLKNNPNNARLHMLVAHAYMQLEELKKAEEHLRKAIEIDPEISRSYQALAFIYEKEGKYEEAIEMLKMYCSKEKFKPLRNRAERKIKELEELK